MHDPKSSEFVKHIPCSRCGSSDANSVYSDGHQWCFKCNEYVGAGHSTQEARDTTTMETDMYQTTAYARLADKLDGLSSAALPDRKLSAQVLEKYGVRVTPDRHLYPYYGENRQLVGIKTRFTGNKTFAWDGSAGNTYLFGIQNFPRGSAKSITICEGEIDTLSAFQMNGAKYPVVGVPSATAFRAVKDNLEYLNTFNNIYLCMDNDIAGHKAKNDMASLFEPGKCKIVDVAPMKDVSDWLVAGKAEDFVRRWWNAVGYTPEGIIRGSSMWEMLTEVDDTVCVPYPYVGLQDMTYGLRKQELVTITAGSGLGKSAFVRELMHHLLNVTDDNIGCMFFEESTKRTGIGFLSISANKPLHLPDHGASLDELRVAYDATLNTDRVFFFDSYGSNTLENIISHVRHMAKSLDCKWIVLDHLSIIVSSQENGDERKAIDEIVTKLRELVQETKIGLLMVSHLRRPQGQGHEDGAETSLSQLRGSAAIGQLSDMVIGLERDGQHENDIIRNTTRVRVLKNRFSGTTGLATHLYYDKVTGRLSEIDDPFKNAEAVAGHSAMADFTS
jgi:twinkle protein